MYGHIFFIILSHTVEIYKNKKVLQTKGIKCRFKTLKWGIQKECDKKKSSLVDL